MAFEFSCPTCQSILHVEDEARGRLIRCGGCLSMLRVPGTAGETAANSTPVEPSLSIPPLGRTDGEGELPRRRRRAPPPRVRGVLFWVMAIFAIFMIGSCACCGGIYLLLPGAEWRTHESVRGGFRIELPAEPREDLPIPGRKADPTLQIEGAVLWKRGEFYAVMYQDLPDLGPPPPAEMALNLAIQGIEADPEVRAVVRKVPITVSGYSAREVEYVGTDGGTYIARLVIAGHRFYRVVSGGRFVSPGNANVRRFLDSFEVLDRKPKRNAER